MRAYEPRDAQAVLAINKECEPDVGPMDLDKLEFLVSLGGFAVVEEDDDGNVVGFLIGLDETASSYTSNNFAWFAERHERFAYIDRIAITEHARGTGIGPSFYRATEAWAFGTGHTVLTAEVHTKPDNPRSRRFHELFGFAEVGRGQPYGNDDEVAYYEMTL